MLTSSQGASRSQPRYSITEIAEGPRPADYIYELVAALPDTRLDSVFVDIAHFERTGEVTSQVQTLLRRVACLSDADMMLRRF